MSQPASRRFVCLRRWLSAGTCGNPSPKWQVSWGLSLPACRFTISPGRRRRPWQRVSGQPCALAVSFFAGSTPTRTTTSAPAATLKSSPTFSWSRVNPNVFSMKPRSIHSLQKAGARFRLSTLSPKNTSGPKPFGKWLLSVRMPELSQVASLLGRPRCLYHRNFWLMIRHCGLDPQSMTPPLGKTGQGGGGSPDAIESVAGCACRIRAGGEFDS